MLIEQIEQSLSRKCARYQSIFSYFGWEEGSIRLWLHAYQKKPWYYRAIFFWLAFFVRRYLAYSDILSDFKTICQSREHSGVFGLKDRLPIFSSIKKYFNRLEGLFGKAEPLVMDNEGLINLLQTLSKNLEAYLEGQHCYLFRAASHIPRYQIDSALKDNGSRTSKLWHNKYYGLAVPPHVQYEERLNEIRQSEGNALDGEAWRSDYIKSLRDEGARFARKSGYAKEGNVRFIYYLSPHAKWVLYHASTGDLGERFACTVLALQLEINRLEVYLKETALSDQIGYEQSIKRSFHLIQQLLAIAKVLQENKKNNAIEGLDKHCLDFISNLSKIKASASTPEMAFFVLSFEALSQSIDALKQGMPSLQEKIGHLIQRINETGRPSDIFLKYRQLFFSKAINQLISLLSIHGLQNHTNLASLEDEIEKIEIYFNALTTLMIETEVEISRYVRSSLVLQFDMLEASCINFEYFRFSDDRLTIDVTIPPIFELKLTNTLENLEKASLEKYFLDGLPLFLKLSWFREFSEIMIRLSLNTYVACRLDLYERLEPDSQKTVIGRYVIFDDQKREAVHKKFYALVKGQDAENKKCDLLSRTFRLEVDPSSPKNKQAVCEEVWEKKARYGEQTKIILPHYLSGDLRFIADKSSFQEQWFLVKEAEALEALGKGFVKSLMQLQSDYIAYNCQAQKVPYMTAIKAGVRVGAGGHRYLGDTPEGHAALDYFGFQHGIFFVYWEGLSPNELKELSEKSFCKKYTWLYKNNASDSETISHEGFLMTCRPELNKPGINAGTSFLNNHPLKLYQDPKPLQDFFYILKFSSFVSPWAIISPSWEEISKRVRRILARLHPDKGNTDPSSQVAFSHWTTLQQLHGLYLESHNHTTVDMPYDPDIIEDMNKIHEAHLEKIETIRARCDTGIEAHEAKKREIEAKNNQIKKSNHEKSHRLWAESTEHASRLASNAYRLFSSKEPSACHVPSTQLQAISHTNA